MTVLKINASARKEGSNSRAVADYLAQQLGEEIIERDLVASPLPPMSAEDLVGVHGSHEPDRDSLRQHLQVSTELIDELKAADTIVFGTPMYNFSVPAYLKQWIDYICRAGVTFRYTANGPEGLTGVKRAFIVTASGGTPIGSDMDFASRYLEQVCRFIGIEDVIHIDASGSKREPEKVIAEAKAQVDVAIEALRNNVVEEV